LVRASGPFNSISPQIMSVADAEDGGGVVEESDACNDRRARIAAIRAKRSGTGAGTAAPPSDGAGAGSGASARGLRMRGAQRAEPEEQDFGASVGNAMAEASAVSSTTGCLDRKAQMEALRAKRAARSQQQEDGGSFGVGGEARAAPGALSARSACHLDLQVDSARTQRLGQRADGRGRDAGHTAGGQQTSAMGGRSPASPAASAGAAPMQQRQVGRPIAAAAALSLHLSPRKKSDDQPWQPGAQIASESYSARQEVKKKKTPPELSSLYVADLDDGKKRSPLQPLDAHAVLARSAAEEARGSGTAAGNSERRIRLDTIRASRASRGQWGVEEADVLEQRAPVPGRPPAGGPGEAPEGSADVGRSARRQRIEAMRARCAGRSFGEGLDEHEGEAREGAVCQQRSAVPGPCTSAQHEQDWRGLEQPLSLSRVESIQVAQRERHANQPSLPSSRVDRIRELQRARGAARLAAEDGRCLGDGGRDDHTQAEGLGASKHEEPPLSAVSRDVGDPARALAQPSEEGYAKRRGVSRQGSRAEDIAAPGGAMNGEGLEGSWAAAEAVEEEEEAGRPQDEEVPPRVGIAPASPAAAAGPVSVSPRQQPAAAEEYKDEDEDDGAEANVDGGDGQIVAVVATPESMQELQVVNPHLEELRLKWQKYTQGSEVVEERSSDEAQECIYHDLLTKWDTAKGGPDAGLSATSALRPLLEPIDVRVCLSGPTAPEEEEPYEVANVLNLELQSASWDGPHVAQTTQAALVPPPWLDAPWAPPAVPLPPPAHVRSIDGGARRPLPKVPGGVPLGGASKPSGLRSQQVDECVHQ